MKKYLHLTLVLFLIAAFSGLLIGYVNTITRDVIALNNEEKTAKGIKSIFADSTTFDDLAEDESSTFEADNEILNLYRVKDKDENVIGYVFKVNAPESYSGTLEALIGFNLDGSVKGISYVNILETSGIGDRVKTKDFRNQFVDKDNMDDVDTLTGATVSSSAVIGAVELVQDYFNKNIKE